MHPYRDLVHNPVFEGDYIVYSALWSRSAVLKFGIVTELTTRKEDKDTLVIKVITVDRITKWDGTNTYKVWELQNNGKPVTLGFLDRLMTVPMLPDELEVLLDEAYEKYQKENS